jgi:hypothetical protein
MMKNCFSFLKGKYSMTTEFNNKSYMQQDWFWVWLMKLNRQKDTKY